MRLVLPPPSRSRISLTALVDVVFILLFFFMLAAQPMNWRAMKLSLSAPPAQAAETRTSPISLTVVALADGALYLSGAPISLDDLLAQLASTPTTQNLRVVPGRGLSMQQLVDLLDRLRSSGVAIQLVNPVPAP